MHEEKAILLLDRTRRADELQEERNANERALNAAKINLVLAYTLNYLSALVVTSVYSLLSVAGVSALLLTALELLIGLVSLFAFFSAEFFLLSLATLSACVLAALIVYSTLGRLWRWSEIVVLNSIMEVHQRSQPEQDLFQLTEAEKASLDFQTEVAKNGFQFVTQTEDKSMSDFLADFLIQTHNTAPNRIHQLIPLMLANPLPDQHQRWVRHVAALLDHTLKSTAINHDVRRTIVIFYLFALFTKEGRYHFSQKRQGVFYDIFQKMQCRHELFACLRNQSVPQGWTIYGIDQYADFSAELLRILAHFNYVHSINTEQNDSLGGGFTSDELFGLVLKGLEALKGKNEQDSYQHVFEVLLLEIWQRRENARISPIINACEAFYIKENRFYEGISGFLNYLKGNNESAYAVCEKTPLNCLIFLNPRTEERKTNAIKALLHLYQKYPNIFSGLLDQIIAGNGGHEVDSKKEILGYLLSALNEEHLDLQDLLNVKLNALDNVDEFIFQQIGEVPNPNPVIYHPAINLQAINLEMERHYLNQRLFELDMQYSEGTNNAIQFDAAIRSLCESPQGGMDVGKITLLFTKLIHGGAILGLFTNSLDGQTQALLNRIVGVISRWSDDHAQHTKGLDPEEEVGVATKALLTEVYQIIESNAGNHKAYDMRALRVAYDQVGLDLESVKLPFMI